MSAKIAAKPAHTSSRHNSPIACAADNYPDTPLPPEEPAGQNPPDGANRFDYLAFEESARFAACSRWRSSTLPGNLVRSFSSTDKPEEVNPKEYQRANVLGASAASSIGRPRACTVSSGISLIPCPSCDAAISPSRLFITTRRSIPQGATVLPGKYMVRLSSERGSVQAQRRTTRMAQPLEIRMDPRVKTSPEDLRRQFDLDRKIAEALHRDHEALQQIRSLRSQIKWLQRGKYANSAASSTALDGAAKIAADLEAKAAALEGTEGGYGSRFMSTPEGRSLARLNGGFGTMLAQLDTADAAPTTQELEMFWELEKALDEQLAAWSQLKTKDLPQLNEELKKAGQPPIDLQKSASAEPTSPQTPRRIKMRIRASVVKVSLARTLSSALCWKSKLQMWRSSGKALEVKRDPAHRLPPLASAILHAERTARSLTTSTVQEVLSCCCYSASFSSYSASLSSSSLPRSGDAKSTISIPPRAPSLARRRTGRSASPSTLPTPP